MRHRYAGVFAWPAMDHKAEALRIAAEAAKDGDVKTEALVHAILHLGEVMKHGLRDMVYELRD